MAKIQKTSEERLNVCAECEHHSKNHNTARPDAHCTHCGCTLAAKTKCLSCSCPIGKWKEVLTRAQEEEIKKQPQEDALEGHAKQQ